MFWKKKKESEDYRDQAASEIMRLAQGTPVVGYHDKDGHLVIPEDALDEEYDSYPEIADKLIGELQDMLWYLDSQLMQKRDGQSEAHYHALHNTRKLIWEALMWQYPYDPKKTHIVLDGVGHSRNV